VNGTPGVIGLKAIGEGVPANPDGDGVAWKPIGLCENEPGLGAA